MRAVLLLALAAALCSATDYCVTYSAGSYTFRHGSDAACSDAVVTGSYTETMNTTGWNDLKMRGNNAYNDSTIAYALGYFEGMASWRQVLDWHYNVLSANGSMPVPQRSYTWLEDNMQWMKQQVATQPVDTDPYWHVVSLNWRQFEGLAAGVQANAPDFSAVKTLSCASAGDLLDIEGIPSTGVEKESWRGLTPSQFQSWVLKRSHCSALIKVTPDLKNVFFGHTTWANFNMMLRIWKSIRPNFSGPGVAANTITFSSWPGSLTSVDDFYVTDQDLFVTETSLNVFNTSIYANVHTSSMLSWVRSGTANRMAHNGSEWADVFRRHNSGTYNNQWMVLDLKKFTPGKDLAAGTLWVLEQMPGRIRAEDMTTVLSYGYWPSYNVPFFKDQFDYAGYPQAIKEQGGDMLDYQTCVRANLFRNYQTEVTSVSQMQWMMQYNNWKYDSLELYDSVYAIAARGDKLPAPQLFGGLDSKITDYASLMKNNTIFAYSGPTPQQGHYAWVQTPELSAVTNRRGLPEVYNFSWMAKKPLQ